MPITIYHNPRCSKSRETLALLEQAGVQPRIIEYLKHPLEKEALRAVVHMTELPLRELLREGEAEYKALQLDKPSVDEDALLDAVIAHPILLNRPIVVTAKGARLCRPPERVLEILP